MVSDDFQQRKYFFRCAIFIIQAPKDQICEYQSYGHVTQCQNMIFLLSYRTTYNKLGCSVQNFTYMSISDLQASYMWHSNYAWGCSCTTTSFTRPMIWCICHSNLLVFIKFSDELECKALKVTWDKMLFLFNIIEFPSWKSEICPF